MAQKALKTDVIIPVNGKVEDQDGSVTLHGSSNSGEPSRSTAETLLKHAGGWKGDDLDQLLDEVQSLRGKAAF
jgi:hypothetical protein